MDDREVAAEETPVNPLAALVQERLEGGPLPASEFMDLALYHPEHGYYRRPEGPWGFEGKDYYTALDVGPLLGMTLACRLEQAWERLDRPARFTVLEPGAGRGWLGRDLLDAASGAFSEALVYCHRDDSPAARLAAERALEPHLSKGHAHFVGPEEALPSFAGAVISNELFDALPAQPWRWDGEQWLEEVLTKEGPSWQAADPGQAGTWFAAQAEDGLQAGDGATWCDAMPPLVRQLSGHLERGLFLAIDYGDETARLLAKGADLRRYKAHAVDDRWWEEPGECDLTADVDFTRLSALLESCGFQDMTRTSLSRWVREHAPLAQWEATWQKLEARERMKRMENLLQLTLPGMMGERFKVLEAFIL